LFRCRGGAFTDEEWRRRKSFEMKNFPTGKIGGKKSHLVIKEREKGPFEK
jgi:hypothetical protein